MSLFFPFKRKISNAIYCFSKQVEIQSDVKEQTHQENNKYIRPKCVNLLTEQHFGRSEEVRSKMF